MTAKRTRQATQATQAALEALGYGDRHASALGSLFASERELETVVVFTAYRFAAFDEDADLGPACRHWSAVIAEALRQHHPKATPEQAALAAQGVVLLALVLHPEMLPASAPEPSLLAAMGGQRLQ